MGLLGDLAPPRPQRTPGWLHQRFTRRCPRCAAQRGGQTPSFATWKGVLAPPRLKCHQKLELSHGRRRERGARSWRQASLPRQEAALPLPRGERCRRAAAWDTGRAAAARQGRSGPGGHLPRGTRDGQGALAAARVSERHQHPLAESAPQSPAPVLARTSPRTRDRLQVVASSAELAEVTPRGQDGAAGQRPGQRGAAGAQQILATRLGREEKAQDVPAGGPGGGCA